MKFTQLLEYFNLVTLAKNKLSVETVKYFFKKSIQDETLDEQEGWIKLSDTLMSHCAELVQ